MSLLFWPKPKGDHQSVLLSGLPSGRPSAFQSEFCLATRSERPSSVLQSVTPSVHLWVLPWVHLWEPLWVPESSVLQSVSSSVLGAPADTTMVSFTRSWNTMRCWTGSRGLQFMHDSLLLSQEQPRRQLKNQAVTGTILDKTSSEHRRRCHRRVLQYVRPSVSFFIEPF